MAPHASLTLPTTAALPGSHRLPPKYPAVSKSLSRLSRASLLALVQQWLEERNQATCAPILMGDEADLEGESIYQLAEDLEELRQAYEEMRERKGGKREVVDRIVDGDWRTGLSLRQIAMADTQYLLDRPSAMRWTATKLTKLSMNGGEDDKAEEETELKKIPRFHASTFLNKLQSEIGALLRAHYFIARMTSLPITLLRIHVQNLPYNSRNGIVSGSPHDVSSTIYVAFPDNTHFVYISFGSQAVSTAADSRSVRKIVVDAIPKAFSRQQERYTLKTTSLTAKSLSALVSIRGAGRGNAAAGGWSIFADGTVDTTPLLPFVRKEEFDSNKENESILEGDKEALKRPRSQFGTELDSTGASIHKRRKLVAATRFGTSAIADDGKGLERLDIRLEDGFSGDNTSGLGSDEAEKDAPPTTQADSQKAQHSAESRVEKGDPPPDEEEQAPSSWAPKVQLTFHGTHVFAGIRKLVELGVVNGERMPGWMTGEGSISVGVVRHGRIRGNKGSGA